MAGQCRQRGEVELGAAVGEQRVVGADLEDAGPRVAVGDDADLAVVGVLDLGDLQARQPLAERNQVGGEVGEGDAAPRPDAESAPVC